MRLAFRMIYLEVVYHRYHKVSKASKNKILDELCKECIYIRKYDIWRMNIFSLERKPKAKFM